MAIDIPRDLFESVAPKYIGDARFETFKAIVLDTMDEIVWGTSARVQYAAALLIAHQMEIADRNGASGEISKRRLGDASIEFNTPSGSGGSNIHELNSTSFGREHLRIRRTIILTPQVSGCQ